MNLKTLEITKNLQEVILYNSHFPALCTSVSHFDDYLQQEWQIHWHDDLEFGVVRNGIVEYTVHDGQQSVVNSIKTGDGFFIGSGYLHSARALCPHSIVADAALPVNFFDSSALRNSFKRKPRLIRESGIPFLVLHADAPNDRPLLSAIQELCSVSEYETGYEFHYVEAVCKILRLLITRTENEKHAGTSAENKLQEQRVKTVLSFIHAHYGENIGINDMVKAAAVSRTECFRCFQTILGKTPTEYLTEYRLSLAAAMLTNTDRTISEISYLCGFNSPSYFGKVFRERIGLSPQKYRMKT